MDYYSNHTPPKLVDTITKKRVRAYHLKKIKKMSGGAIIKSEWLTSLWELIVKYKFMIFCCLLVASFFYWRWKNRDTLGKKDEEQ